MLVLKYSIQINQQTNHSNQRPILKATYWKQTNIDTRCGIEVDNQRRISSVEESLQGANPVEKKKRKKKSIQAK